MKVEDLENSIDKFLINIRDYEINKSSLQVYRTNIVKFVNYLKENNKNSFDKDVYIDYRDYMKNIKKYKLTTINKYIVILNKYFMFLGREDLKIKQIKYQRKHYIENVPTVADYKRIIRSAKKNDPVAYYFLQIVSYTGMRVSAILELTIEILKESKYNEDYVKIHSKGKYNEVPLPAWLRRELLKFAKEQKRTTGYIFPSPKIKDKALTRKAMWEKVQKVTGKARVSLDKGHPHAFRHLFGKEISGQVNDNLVIADILGHESTKTSEIYQQKTKKEISKIVNNFRFK